MSDERYYAPSPLGQPPLATLRADDVPAALSSFPLPPGWEWPPEKEPGRSWFELYVARGPNRTVKIGRSGTPIERMRQLSQWVQKQSIGVRLGGEGDHRLIVTIPNGDARRERALLRLVHHEQVSGEWSRGPDSELLIATLASYGLHSAAKASAA